MIEHDLGGQQQAQPDARQRDHGRGRPHHPDREEEPHQHQLLDAAQRLGKLSRLGMAAKHDPEDQRPQITLQADRVEIARPRHQREEKPPEDQQLAMAGRFEQPVQHPPHRGQHQQQHRQRPERGVSALAQREEDDREDVLHDEDSDRDLAMKRRQVSLLVEHLDRKHGAREGKREGKDQGRPE